MTQHRFIPGEGTKFHIEKKWDMAPNIASAAELRSNGMVGNQESWHVARIDKRMLDKLIKEAGLTWDDTEAVRDMIDKKLRDGTLAKLRVHEGNF